METKYLITFALILAGIAGTEIYNNLKTTGYVQCRQGNIYGTWLPTEIETLFKCDLTGEEQLCWRITKTRCYLFNTSNIIYGNGKIWQCNGNEPYSKCYSNKGTETYFGELI